MEMVVAAGAQVRLQESLILQALSQQNLTLLTRRKLPFLA